MGPHVLNLLCRVIIQKNGNSGNGSRPRPERRHDGSRLDEANGEIVDIRERLVISPAWGRLRTEPLEIGQRVKEGAIIGRLEERGQEIPLIAHCHGSFLAWLEPEGVRIPPGRAVASLLFLEE